MRAGDCRKNRLRINGRRFDRRPHRLPVVHQREQHLHNSPPRPRISCTFLNPQNIMLDHDLLLKLAVRPNSTKTTLERAVSGEPFFLFSDTGMSSVVHLSFTGPHMFLGGLHPESAITGLTLSAWELFHRLTREEVVHYLDTRKRQGFNAVLAVALPELE